MFVFVPVLDSSSFHLSTSGVDNLGPTWIMMQFSVNQTGHGSLVRSIIFGMVQLGEWANSERQSEQLI